MLSTTSIAWLEMWDFNENPYLCGHAGQARKLTEIYIKIADGSQNLTEGKCAPVALVPVPISIVGGHQELEGQVHLVQCASLGAHTTNQGRGL